MEDRTEPTHLDELKRRLYKREQNNSTIKRSTLPSYSKASEGGWQPRATPFTPVAPPRRSWLGKLLVTSIIFFVLALAAGTYFWFFNTNVVASKNIDFKINGPTTVRAGDPLSLDVIITNRNNQPITDAQLVIDYPVGTRSATDATVDLSQVREQLGTVAPGEAVHRAVGGIFFGPEGTTTEINFTLEYLIPSSDATFKKFQTYSLTLNASPINLAVDLPSEVNSNHAITVNLKAVSNSAALLQNVSLIATYPPGFQFTTSDTPPTKDQNIWLLGDMPAGTEKDITFSGILEGQSDETKAFQFLVGSAAGGDVATITVPYGQVVKTIVVKKDYIALNVGVDDKSDPTIVESAETSLNSSAAWTNNLPDSVVDSQLVVSLSGNAFDQSHVTTLTGNFSSSDNTITWDKTSFPSLSSISPAGTGNVAFRFSSLPLVSSGGVAIKNPVVNLHFKFTGIRVSSGFSNQPIETDLDRTVKFNSKLTLNQRLLYHNGSLTNSGSIPPKINKPTTYTVVWTVTNSSNDIQAATVQATLPDYVTWTGNLSPTSEHVSFDPRNRQVLWNLGDLPAGLGIQSQGREVSFQISFLPSLTQVGSSPVLVNKPTIAGLDSFTKANLSITKDSLTSLLIGDPTYKPGDETVIK